MPWNRDDIRRRINEVTRTYGDWVVHEEGIPCSCQAASGLRLAAGCPHCDGEGFLWINPRRLKGILMGVRTDRRLASMGWLTPGDLTFTTDVHSRVHDFDRITLTVPEHTEPEILVRGKSYQDGVPGLAPNEDRLAYQAVEPIACVTHDRLDQGFVHGDDYVFAGKTIRWLKPPPDGTAFVVKYEALTEWIAFSSPFEVIDRGRHLGQKVLLRKRHLVNLRENPHRDVETALGL